MTVPLRLVLAVALLAASPFAWGAGTTPGPIPPLRIADAEGKTIVLDAPGVLYLVDFWAPGCKPCTLEMPDLERLAKEYEPGGRFRLVTVLGSGYAGKELLELAEQAGSKLPFYSDGDNLLGKFEISMFPTKLLIRDGILLARKRGGGTNAYALWSKRIDEVLATSSAPETPR